MLGGFKRVLDNVMGGQNTSDRNTQNWYNLVNNMPDPVARFNEKLQFVFVNAAFLKNTGRTESEILGRTNIEIAGENEVNKDWTIKLKKVFDTGEAAEMTAFYPGADKMFFMITKIVPEFDDSGKVTSLLAIGRDMTEQKRVELELIQKNIELANFKRITDSTHDVIISLDMLGKITYWNPAAEALYGYWFEEVKGKSLIELTVPAEKIPEIKELSKKISDGLSIVDLITQRINRKNRTIDVVINIFPLKNEYGEIIGSCGIARDITEQLKDRKRIDALNAELMTKNRELKSLNSELKTFTGIAANDYSATLKLLYTNLEYIVTNDAQQLSNTGRSNIRKAQAAIQKMKLLTEDIVAFTRLHELDKKEQTVDLNDIMKTVLQDLHKTIHEANIQIDCTDLPLTKGYAFLISLVFHHLIDNAIKFRRDDVIPTITVDCRKSVKGTDIKHESAFPHATYHIITITDNGIGFNMADSEKIFQIFNSLHLGKYKGSGIGLAICKKVMELHGGFITVDSKPLEGSTFSCYFPLIN